MEAIRVEGIVTASMESEGDGKVEHAIRTIAFLVPLEGGETSWHLQSPLAVETMSFRFHCPDIPGLIAQAHATGRDEVIEEFRSLSLEQIAERLFAEED